MNFFPSIRDRFFSNATALIQLASARWVGMWGKLDAGPINVDCLAETWPSTSTPLPPPPWAYRNCGKDPQPVPYHYQAGRDSST